MLQPRDLARETGGSQRGTAGPGGWALHRHRDTRAQLVDNCDYCQHSFLNRVAAAEVASCKALWPNDTHLLMAVDQVAEAEHVLNGRVFSIVGV